MDRKNSGNAFKEGKIIRELSGVYLDKEVLVYRQGLQYDFLGKVIEVKKYDKFGLIGIRVVDSTGRNMLVFNINHIKLIK